MSSPLRPTSPPPLPTSPPPRAARASTEPSVAPPVASPAVSAPTILIALSTVGAGLPLEEELRRAGAKVRWDANAADGPPSTVPPGERTGVVILDADHLGERLGAVAAAWRASPSLPGVVAIGDGEAARRYAPAAHVTLLAGKASTATLCAAVQEAYRLRLGASLAWPNVCAAVGQAPLARDAATVSAVVIAARAVPLELPRVALGPYAHHYATANERCAEVVAERRLALPEQSATLAFDGTLTLQNALNKGPLDPAQTARLTWALVCAGAVELTVEPRDKATPARRALAELRRHLAQRRQRLPGGTYYDVLEITPLADPPQIEEAYRLQALRYAPHALASYDLSDLASSIQPMWELVEKARATLMDLPARGRYHDWLRSKSELRTVWAVDPEVARLAIAAFERGQRALGEGDVHRAVSELATACRTQPGHPEHEATLSWARYRVQVAAGGDRDALAKRERKALDAMLTGIRPWPRALVALALLCAADGDVDAARWHLSQALTVDPAMPAAIQLQQRLNARR